MTIYDPKTKALIDRLLKNPDLFPDEFKNWLPRFVSASPVTELSQNQLATGAIVDRNVRENAGIKRYKTAGGVVYEGLVGGTLALKATDDVVICTGNGDTIQLPKADTVPGKFLTIKSGNANVHTVSPYAGDTIEGSGAGIALNNKYECLELLSGSAILNDGVTDWFLVGRRVPVTTADLADGSVTSAKILDGTIAAADLGTGSVTNAKLGADAVTTDKILDGTILNADLSGGYPQLSFGQVKATSSLIMTTSYQDVAGCSVTIGPGTFLLLGIFDFNPTAGSGTAVGTLNIQGTDLTKPEAHLHESGTRATVAAAWIDSEAGSVTYKLRAKVTAGGGVNPTCFIDHTSLTYLRVA